MPTAILEDSDFIKMFSDMGYNCGVIIDKRINKNGEVVIVWRHN